MKIVNISIVHKRISWRDGGKRLTYSWSAYETYTEDWYFLKSPRQNFFFYGPVQFIISVILRDETWYWPGFLREENKPNQRSWIFLNYRFLSRDGDTGEPGGPLPLTFFFSFFFCVARKKENQTKKERVLKQKLLKGYHQGQSVTVLAIVERLEFKSFSCRPTMVPDNTFMCSMAPIFWNSFCRPCSFNNFWWK